ncbi:MAG: hypothetical protein KGI50_01590 [Patescibacteria group bacterium]|nr:hypothetical protein [Patescibacteria group bacterium]
MKEKKLFLKVAMDSSSVIPGSGCAIAYCFSEKIIRYVSKRFCGTPQFSGEKTPNYPIAPILKKSTERSDQDLWKKILGLENE